MSVHPGRSPGGARVAGLRRRAALRQDGPVTRVAIIGNGGGGKTRIAARIGGAVSLPVYEIDAIQWRPGWLQAQLDEVEARHDEILERERWVIDGWGGTWQTLERRFARADTIVLVDLPVARHSWWATKRAVRARKYPIARLYRTISSVHRRALPRLRETVARQHHAVVVSLSSPRDIRRLLDQIGSRRRARDRRA